MAPSAESAGGGGIPSDRPGHAGLRRDGCPGGPARVHDEDPLRRYGRAIGCAGAGAGGVRGARLGWGGGLADGASLSGAGGSDRRAEYAVRAAFEPADNGGAARLSRADRPHVLYALLFAAGRGRGGAGGKPLDDVPQAVHGLHPEGGLYDVHDGGRRREWRVDADSGRPAVVSLRGGDRRLRGDLSADGLSRRLELVPSGGPEC